MAQSLWSMLENWASSPAVQMGLTGLGAADVQRAQDETDARTAAQDAEIRGIRGGIPNWIANRFGPGGPIESELRGYGQNRNRILGDATAGMNFLYGGYEDRERTGLADVDQFGRAVYGGARERESQLGRGYESSENDIMSFLDSLSAQQGQGYEDRYNRNVGMLNSLGEQERADIEQRFQDEEATILKSLSDRGLGGTTALESVRQSLMKGKNDEFGRLREKLTRERVNLDANLSGEALTASEKMGMNRAGFGFDLSGRRLKASETLSGDALGFLETYGANRVNVGAQLSGDALSALQRSQEQNIGYDMGLTSELLGLRSGRLDQRLGYEYGAQDDMADYIERIINSGPGGMDVFLAMAQAAGANSASPYEPEGPNMGMSIGSGAAQGAAAGTAIFPGWGTLIGAGAGAVSGYFGAS